MSNTHRQIVDYAKSTTNAVKTFLANLKNVRNETRQKQNIPESLNLQNISLHYRKMPILCRMLGRISRIHWKTHCLIRTSDKIKNMMIF